MIRETMKRVSCNFQNFRAYRPYDDQIDEGLSEVVSLRLSVRFMLSR